MKRKLSSLQPNEAIYIANKKEAKAICKLTNKVYHKELIARYLWSNGSVWEWQAIWNGLQLPASDFIPKRKNKLKALERRLTALERFVKNPFNLVEEIQTVSEHVQPTKLEAGKWYKAIKDPLSIVFKSSESEGYGFNTRAEWVDYCPVWTPDFWTPATPEEVSTSLINEAKRRYKVGDVINSLAKSLGAENCKLSDDYFECCNYTVQGKTAEKDWDKNHSNPWLYRDGQWAEIVEQPLTELPEKWVVRVTTENAETLTEWKIEVSNGFFTGDAYEYDFIAHNGEGLKDIPEGYTLLSESDFKRLVLDAEPKEKFDWGKQGNYAQGISGNAIFMITGTGSLNNTFSGVCLIEDSDTNKGEYSDNWDIEDFKPYTGEPITLK